MPRQLMHELLIINIIAACLLVHAACEPGSDKDGDTGADSVEERSDMRDDAVEDLLPDDARDMPDTDMEGPFLTIVVQGSSEDRSPDDGLASQTPDPYYYGLQRLELLRSADDTDPELIFDYDPDYILVDMHGRNEVAYVPLSTLPEGSFLFFRFVLTLLEGDVEAQLHDVPVIGTTTTTLTILQALSDNVTIEDETRNQGDVVISGEAEGIPFSVPAHWDLVYPEPAPASWSESIDGKTRVTSLMVPPLLVSPDPAEDVTQVIVYYIANGFRWQDEDNDGYDDDVWDVTIGAIPHAEPVLRFGANDYEVYTESP